MGANKTQAQAVLLFLIAFVCIAAGLAEDINYLWVVLGALLGAGSITLFVKCRPWEYRGEEE